MLKYFYFFSFCSILLNGCIEELPLPFTEDGCIINTTTIKEKNVNLQVNLFFETSGSMAGFMPLKGAKATQFQDDMWELISNLSTDYPNGVSINQVRARGEQLVAFNKEDFRNKMNNGKFQLQTSTDIPEMLDSVISRVNQSSVSVLVSDLIFSPEDKNIARIQQIDTDIKNRFANKKLSSEIFLFTSRFIGKVSVEKSPYYVWVIGPQQGVRKISETIRNNFEGLKELSYAVEYETPDYSIMPYSTGVSNAIPLPCTNKKRYFVWTDLDQSEIPSLEFYVALNLSHLPTFCRDPIYLKENLKIPQSNVEVVSVESFTTLKSNSDKQLAAKLGATHLLKLRASNILEENKVLTVNLLNKEPKWPLYVDTVEDDKSRNKTFGLLQMIKGLNGSFEHEEFLLKEPLQILISKHSN